MTILKATKNDAKAILTPFEQGVGEGDWRRYQARVKGHGKVLSINTGLTTNTALAIGEEAVAEGDQLYLQEGLDATVKPVIPGVVNSGTTTLDILGDGSCIALCNLDGNANDVGGNYDGTWTGTEQYAAGRVGQQAALFDGNSHIDSSVQPPTASTTVSLWFRLVAQTTQVIASCSRVELAVKYNTLQLGVNSGWTSQNLILSPDTWYHVVFDGLGNCYVNKDLRAPGATESATIALLGLRIGARTIGGLNLASGSMVDQVRIFNRILTQQEVDVLYNGIGQQIDISSAGFTNAPTRAVLKAPSIGICLEDEARRCISTDYNVPITQAFNNTIVTSLPEFDAVTRDCLDVGDSIVLTVDGSPVTTEILTIDKTTPDQYTITFAPQPTPPTACTVLSRAVAQTNPVPVGDWDGDNMTLEYDAVLKQGRALEISVQGDDTHEVAQVNVDLYKEVI